MSCWTDKISKNSAFTIVKNVIYKVDDIIKKKICLVKSTSYKWWFFCFRSVSISLLLFNFFFLLFKKLFEICWFWCFFDFEYKYICYTRLFYIYAMSHIIILLLVWCNHLYVYETESVENQRKDHIRKLIYERYLSQSTLLVFFFSHLH